jgi:heme exporter protein A
MRLKAEGLSAIRGGRAVFAGVSFAVGPGEALAVTGANGSGKSTLLRLLAGLLTPVEGAVLVEPKGEDSAIHYLGHLDGLKTALTVRQNLAFWQTLWNGGPIDPALERLGIARLADLHAGVLSAGQKRRVALARLLIAKRPVWLLDEPATALDAMAEETLAGVVAEHLAGGGIAVVATHRPLPYATKSLALGAVA